MESILEIIADMSEADEGVDEVLTPDILKAIDRRSTEATYYGGMKK